MPRGMKLQGRAAPRPLLPPALRGTAALVVTGCAAVTASLGLAFAGQSRPDALDAAVDAHVRSGLGPYEEQLRLLARLGGQVPFAVLTAALILACLATRRWRGAVLAGVAVPGAVALTEYVLKPLVGRTILSGYDCYPSGHTTALFTLATTCAVLLTGPARPRLPGATRLLLVLAAALIAAGVAASMVARGYHYFTDTIGGAAVGSGIVLLAALVIDWAADSPRARSLLRHADATPAATAPDVTIDSPGPVGR